MGFLLSIAAAILVILGLVNLFQGDFLWAILLFVAACLVGPGGYSVFRRSRY